MLSAVCQFVGVAIVYNIDKKTLAKMTADLGRDVTADDVVVVPSNRDDD
jgi:hypothetical protein